MMSLRKFSKLAGVSPATVSRAFSHPDDVAVKTRKHVYELAERLDFRPSAVGNAAHGGKTRSVGVVMPGLEVSYFSDITLGVQDILLKKNYLPITLCSRQTKLPECLKRLMDHRIDALIAYAVNESLTRDSFADLLKLHIPIVSLSAAMAHFQCDSIGTDDYQGGRLVAEHLLSLGHRDMAITYFGEGSSDCEARLMGFSQRLAADGIPIPEENILAFLPRDKRNKEEFRLRIADLLSSPKRPTAIFATTDIHASIIYQVAAQLKIRIPDDVSVVGYADLDFAPHLQPPLTTVRQDGFRVGQLAAEKALQLITGPELPPENQKVDIELVVRGSTAPLNA